MKFVEPTPLNIRKPRRRSDERGPEEDSAFAFPHLQPVDDPDSDAPTGHYERFDAPERRRRWVSVLICIALAATGSAAAFGWRAHEGASLTMSSKASPASEVAQEALLKNLTEAQQRMAASAQRSQELLQTQDGDIKRLSEAIAQLATQLDALAARNALASAPPPAPKKPAAPKVVAPKPRAPAPLSLAPDEKH